MLSPISSPTIPEIRVNPAELRRRSTREHRVSTIAIKSREVQLSRFVPPIELSVLFHHLRAPSRLLGLSLVAPAFVALIYRELISAVVFTALAILCYAFGRVGGRSGLGDASTRDAFVVAACAYLLFALVGAAAYWPSVGLVNGLFEAMSGFTTTGLSVVDVSALPRSLLFFRSYSQWIGGAGIVVLSIAFLPAPRRLLVRLYATEFKDENVLGNLAATTRLVFIIYGSLTALAWISYVAVGMSGFDGLLHALSTISTGGFSPHGESIGHYGASRVKLVVCVFMIAGAIAFPLYYRARRDGLRRVARDAQLRALGLVIAGGFLVATMFTEVTGDGRAAVDRIFHVVSSVTTTGFSTTDPQTWPEGLRMVSTALMIIGGSAGSTAGGIKLFRLLILIAMVRWCFARAVLPPEAHVPVRLGERALHEDDLRAAAGLVTLYLAIVGLSTAILALTHAAPAQALFESVSALGTVGLSAGVTSASLPLWAKAVLIFDMWAGRLEIVPLLILFYPRTWRRRAGGTE
jgi:trk system potassium uptake protein TrkH